MFTSGRKNNARDSDDAYQYSNSDILSLYQFWAFINRALPGMKIALTSDQRYQISDRSLCWQDKCQNKGRWLAPDTILLCQTSGWVNGVVGWQNFKKISSLHSLTFQGRLTGNWCSMSFGSNQRREESIWRELARESQLQKQEEESRCTHWPGECRVHQEVQTHKPIQVGSIGVSVGGV